MERSSQEIWKDNFKSILSRVSRLNSWLIVLHLTIGFTLFRQYHELKELRPVVKQYDKIVGQPWDSLKVFYEESNGYLADYTSSQAMPWYRLCVTTGWGTMVLNEFLPPPAKDNPKITSVIKQISYAARALGSYSSNLTKVLSAQRNSKSFSELNGDELLSLISIYNFSLDFNQDSVNMGTNKADTFGIFFQDPKNRPLLTKKRGMSPELSNTLKFADTQPVFFMFDAEIFLRDNKTFQNYKSMESTYVKLRKFLHNTSFENLGSVQASRSESLKRIKDIESGRSIDIPVLGLSISAMEFVTLAGILNLAIILYLLRTLKSLKITWRNSEGEPAENLRQDADAYFYDWHFGINNRIAFRLFYSFFLSFMTLANLWFAMTAIGDSGMSIVFIAIFTMVNLTLSFVLSARYFNLNKNITA